MSYRYNTVDIIVGVGMCAILFGALLFFGAANGTYRAAVPQPIYAQETVDNLGGMTWLQPVIGQTVVDEALFERRTNHLIAQSAVELNRATLAANDFDAGAAGPFGAVRHQAETMPADHQAHVQGIMGRAIVNGTKRGVRNGALSADLYLSDYNNGMIRTIEARGQQLDDAFSSTWQATLGRSIVEAFQRYTERAGAIQERIGSALVHVALGQWASEEGRAALEPQLGSLVLAAVRTEALSDQLQLLAAIEFSPEEPAAVTTEPASWPEIPAGFFAAAGLALMAVFFGGITLAARRRDRIAMTEMQHNAAKWVYRPAA